MSDSTRSTRCPSRAMTSLGLFAAGRLEHLEAVAAQDGRGERAHRLVVLDEQDRLRGPAGSGGRRRRRRGRRLALGFGARQIDGERGAAPRLAVDPDVAAGLRDDAVDGGEAEAGAAAALPWW